jgi:hypothetical protein
VPLGYRKDDEQRLVPDPATAPIVVSLFDRRADGASWTELSHWMADIGRPMSRSGLKALIENEAYVGVARSGSFRNEEAHEPIVSSALFDRTQEVRGLRPVRTGALSSVAMLRSLCRCGTCGATMTVTWTRGAANVATGNREKVAAYACRGDSARGRCDARAYARADALDAHVERFVLDAFEGRGPLAEAIAPSDELDSSARALEDAEHVLRELLASTRLATTLGVDEYTMLIESAKAEKEHARRAYADVRKRSRALDGFEGAMLAAWPSLTPNEKREILGGFVERVVVRASRGERGLSLESRIQVVFAGNITLKPYDEAWVASAKEG